MDLIVMTRLVTVVIALLAFVSSSNGQRCFSDDYCRATHCCVKPEWSFTGRCMNRERFSSFCASLSRCRSNLNCRRNECCRLTSRGRGVCEPKPRGEQEGFLGLTMICPPLGPKPCQSKRDCGPNECCRLNASGQGRCVHHSHEGEACSTGKRRGIVDVCPCDIGLECEVSATSSATTTGVCKSHMSGCSSHRECQEKRKKTCCKSVGMSKRICVTNTDLYGKCEPLV